MQEKTSRRSGRDFVRAKQSVTHIGTKSSEVAYHRRHAEWLALVMLLWMARNWKYQNDEIFLKAYGDMRQVEELLIKLSQAASRLLTSHKLISTSLL